MRNDRSYHDGLCRPGDGIRAMALLRSVLFSSGGHSGADMLSSAAVFAQIPGPQSAARHTRTRAARTRLRIGPGNGHAHSASTVPATRFSVRAFDGYALRTADACLPSEGCSSVARAEDACVSSHSSAADVRASCGDSVRSADACLLSAGVCALFPSRAADVRRHCGHFVRAAHACLLSAGVCALSSSTATDVRAVPRGLSRDGWPNAVPLR